VGRFSLHKKIVRIIAGAQLRTSLRGLFKELGILPVPCQYRGADKSLAHPGRKRAIVTEDFEFHISYL